MLKEKNLEEELMEGESKEETEKVSQEIKQTHVQSPVRIAM